MRKLIIAACVLVVATSGYGQWGQVGGMKNAADTTGGVTIDGANADTLFVNVITGRFGATSISIPIAVVITGVITGTSMVLARATLDSLWLLPGTGEFVRIEDNNSEVFVVDADGDVGIRTASPQHDLSLYNSSPVVVLTDTDVNLDVSSAAQAIDTSAIVLDASSAIPAFLMRSSTGDVVFDIESDGDLNYRNGFFFGDSSAGRIGIGTATPSTLFHIDPELGGDADNDSAFVVTGRGHVGIGTASPGVVNLLVLGVGGAEIQAKAVGTVNSSIVKARNADGELVEFISNGSTTAGTRAGINRADLAELLTNQTAGLLIDVASNAMMAFATNDIERMRILAGGDIGIGTTTPFHLMHLDSTDGNFAIVGSVDSTVILADSANFNSGKIVFDSNGNVGIGTTSPQHDLSLYSSDPQVVGTDTDINLNISSAAQAADTAGYQLHAVSGFGRLSITSDVGERAYFGFVDGGANPDTVVIEEDAGLALRIGRNSIVIATDGAVSVSGNLNVAGTVQQGGVQINSDDLSDVASIAMLDETETTSAAWTFNAFGTGNFVANEYDMRVATNDTAALMRIGNLEFGTSDDRTISPSLIAGGAIFFGSQVAPDGIGEFIFTASNGDIRFALPIAGASYGTYNARSMIIAGPSVLKDSVMIGNYWGFNRIWMNTNSLGADLGVQNNLQVGDSIFVNTNITVGGEQFTSQSDSSIIDSDLIATTGDGGFGTTNPISGFHIDDLIDTLVIDLGVDIIHANATQADTSALRIYKNGSNDPVLEFIDSAGNITTFGTKPYGAMGFADSSFVIAATQNSYFHITNAANDLFAAGVISNVTVDGDSVTVNSAGNYRIDWDISFSGANADHYHIAIFVNGTEQAGKGETHRGMSSSDEGVSAGHTILALSANDGINLRIKNTANNNDPTMVAGNLVIEKM